MKSTALAIRGTVAGLACLGLVVFGGWEARWWFTAHNAQREGHVIRNSYSNQQTLRDQITAKLGDVTQMDTQIQDNPGDKAQLTAQRHAIAQIVCQDAEQVSGDPLPADQQNWVSVNCELGNAK